MPEDVVRGALGTAEARAILPAVQSLLQEARAREACIAFTLDTHGEDYLCTQEGRRLPVPHCIRGTEGGQIVSELKTEGALLFEKNTFGSLPLAEYVRREAFERVTLCGVCTDICVVSNALLIKAYAPEAEVRVAKDACAGVTPAAHEAALLTMKSCQIVAF